MQGRYYWDLFLREPGQREEAQRILERLRSGDEFVDHETTWHGADGAEAVIYARYTPILDGQGEQRYLICGLDVTERVRQQEELRASRARIVEAADQARRRLERNLHDGAQQRLVSLSLALRLAHARLKQDPDGAAQTLTAASAELALALEELRELARGLHPSILTDRGLGPALESLAGRAPIPVELDLCFDARFPDSVEAAAFYLVSESLANVAKYSQASCASVRVGQRNGHAVVEVADDGVGGADPSRGSGLRGLLDRIEALDGCVELDSSPGRGTQIRALIPLSA